MAARGRTGQVPCYSAVMVQWCGPVDCVVNSGLGALAKPIISHLDYYSCGFVSDAEIFVRIRVRRKPVLVIILKIRLETWGAIGPCVWQYLASHFDDLHVLIIDPHLSFNEPR